MTYKKIFFDLDGTLSDSKEGIIKSLYYAIDKMGLEKPTEAFLQSFLGPPLWYSFINKLGLSEKDATTMVGYFRERFIPLGIYENTLYEGVKTLLQRLDKKKDIEIYIATAKPETSAITVLDYFKITKVILKRGEINGKRVALKPIDCLDICNIIGENVVVGGVRRTAEMIIIDANDQECIDAKSSLYKQINGKWEVNTDLIHRQMSNNSIYYKEKPTRARLKWQIEKMRYSGEPSWINGEAAEKRRPNIAGVNPCGEILLDSNGVCNLTTINTFAYVDENGILDEASLLEAQRLSARAAYRMTCVELELPRWNHIQQRDRLLGCSLTGWQDMVNATGMSKDKEATLLRQLRATARKAGNEYAKSLDHNKPLLITTVKPEGTLSQLPAVSSGVHYSHSEYFIRRVRINAHDPLVKVCEELGYPVFPEVGQDWNNCVTKVIEFPIKAPKGKTKYDVSAIEQLENYKMFMKNYVDHNCSITISVRNNEWNDVEEWVWNNWDDLVAVSFLPLNDSFYELLPYEAITKEEYKEKVKKMKPFIPSLIQKYEQPDVEFELSNDGCETGICPVR